MNFLISFLMILLLSLTNLILGARFHNQINDYLDMETSTCNCDEKKDNNNKKKIGVNKNINQQESKEDVRSEELDD